MKTLSKIKIVAIAMLGMAIAGCEKSMDDLAVNPNSPESVNAEWFVTAAEKEFMDNMWDEWINGRTGMFYAQYWAATSYTEESRYQIREGVNRDFWRAFYTGMNDLEEAKRLAEGEPGTQNKVAIANILKAWAIHVLTDHYGAIPVSEALRADEDVLVPAYDTQPDIYMMLLDMLETAVGNLDETGASFGRGELIYDGDVAQWKKFANSIRLRIAMRMIDVNNAEATAVISSIGSDPTSVMESNNDNALFPYQSANPNNNPINENFKTREDFALSDVMVNYMDSLDDPRLPIYAQPTASSGDYVGITYGLSNSAATAIPNANVSLPGTAVLAPDAPGIYMLYSEVCFILSEAAARGIAVSGSAEQWFENGIRSNMQFWGVEDQTAVDAYVAAQGFNEGDYIDVIGTQKWIALYMQGLQGWYTFSRMDFTKVTGEPLFHAPAAGSLDPDLVGMYPKRMTYPDEEYSLNGDNLNAAVADQGADSKATMLWWDVQ